MIKTLLIANRGEIAVRIIRTCRQMGIKTVAVYSVADADSLHIQLADRSVCIGPSSTKESYLHMHNIISAALGTRCDAIHPGVGFLAENSIFASMVEQAGLIFVGPKAQTIALLGDKIAARQAALEAHVPLTPGSTEPIADFEAARLVARDLGYPVILKACGGGGGRGMRIVCSEKELKDAIAIASEEALAFFGNGTILMEKYLHQSRHIEIQLLGDEHRVVSLGERDCTIQKNHQKLIEESPSPALTSLMRQQMSRDAIRLLDSIGYKGAGTVEFLVQDGSYYFMEVNARVQVEHPVTEMLSTVDLIRQQLLIASQKPMEISDQLTEYQTHALECRINALEAGTVEQLTLPSGPFVRVDSHLYPGYRISPFYDALLAKIIVHTPNRQQSIATMKRALNELHIKGIKTNKEEQLQLLKSKEFCSGRFTTDLYERLFQRES